ncbi:MAG: hypothetical protein M3O74_02285 [Pseudomonadota bacterium]|nr:hypothetical protein [Pseudomonadota bacterium]
MSQSSNTASHATSVEAIVRFAIHIIGSLEDYLMEGNRRPVTKEHS